MARRQWTPETATEAQVKALKAIDKLMAADEKLKADIRQAVEAARDVGVPGRFLAAKFGQGRATLYRHVPAAKKTDDSEETA